MYFRTLIVATTAIALTMFTNHSIAKRISETKCEEYSEYLRPSGFINFLLPPPFDFKPKPKCEESINKFIISGRDAEFGEYPYQNDSVIPATYDNYLGLEQVAIGYDTSDGILWGCGGGIISSQFVITAAHCVETDRGFPKHILVGDTKLSEGKHFSKTRLVVGVKETFVNPGYIPPVKYNDVALIKLDRNLSFCEDLMPACLVQHERDLDNKTWLTVSGWGWTKALDRESQADTLQTVNLTIWDKTECNTFFTDGVVKIRYPNGIIESQICAGDKTGGRDSCQGDSGSPIVYKNPTECIYYIAGVTHGGSSVCGLSTPGIYTNVTSYLDWIESIVWPYDDNSFSESNGTDQELTIPDNKIGLDIKANKSKEQETAMYKQSI